MWKKTGSFAQVTAFCVAISWASTPNSHSRLGLSRFFIGSEIAIAKNLEAGPPLGGTGGSLGMDEPMEWVPDLVGKDPKDPRVIKEFLEGTGFTVEVIGQQTSQTIKKGAVISQTPKPLADVKKPGKVKVIISSGPGK